MNRPFAKVTLRQIKIRPLANKPQMKLNNVRARKGSGGVAVLIRDYLLYHYDVNLIDKKCDGIVGVELKNKTSGYTIHVYACYLPPVDSPYSNTTKFLGHLINKLYMNSHVDMFVASGDFNARIGSKQDYIEQVDSTTKRISIDTLCNANFDVFLEFLKDAKLCTLNGRVTPECDDYTCLNSRGKSVVDYILTTHKNISRCLKCMVFRVNNLLESHEELKLFSWKSMQNT